MRKSRHKRSSKAMKGIMSRNKAMKGILIGSAILVAMYLAVSAFFMNHFQFGSQINGVNVSFKTVKEAEKQISSIIDTYELELNGKDNINEKIAGKDIKLSYDPKDEIKKVKDSQKPLSWIKSIFKKDNSQIDVLVTFDKDSLKEKLNKSPLINNKNIIESKDVSFEYTSKGYKIIDEVYGNKIKKDYLYEKIENSILESKSKLNLDEENCYEKPKYTSKSKEVMEAKELLDKYTGLKITYNFSNDDEEIDGDTINKWLSIDKNMNVTFNESQIRKYVDSLAAKYNTFGKTRKFAASTGKTVDVYGGNYGWILNKSEEVKSLIETIKKGKDATKEPIYSQKAASHDSNDIGNTYVEINLTKQHMWLYKDGTLVTETDVVTGDISKNFGTPAGTYRLTYKEKNATLKGEGYSAPVEFWMPFNGNIGIHDAPWRKDEFGKEIYKTNGSHGCVNTPPSIAGIIFDNIQSGTPIVCYTE